MSSSKAGEFHFNWRDNSEKESHWHEEKCGSLSLLQLLLLLPCSLHFDELWHCNGGFFDFWLAPCYVLRYTQHISCDCATQFLLKIHFPKEIFWCLSALFMAFSFWFTCHKMSTLDLECCWCGPPLKRLLLLTKMMKWLLWELHRCTGWLDKASRAEPLSKFMKFPLNLPLKLLLLQTERLQRNWAIWSKTSINLLKKVVNSASSSQIRILLLCSISKGKQSWFWEFC